MDLCAAEGMELLKLLSCGAETVLRCSCAVVAELLEVIKLGHWRTCVQMLVFSH